jgi:hypothetical protein
VRISGSNSSHSKDDVKGEVIYDVTPVIGEGGWMQTKGKENADS